MLQLGYREQQTGPLITSSVVWEVQFCRDVRVLTPPNLLILSKVLWGLYRCWLPHRVEPIESLKFDPNMSILGQTLPVQLTRDN